MKLPTLTNAPLTLDRKQISSKHSQQSWKLKTFPNLNQQIYANFKDMKFKRTCSSKIAFFYSWINTFTMDKVIK